MFSPFASGHEAARDAAHDPTFGRHSPAPPAGSPDLAAPHDARPRWLTAIDLAAVTSFSILLARLCAGLAHSSHRLHRPWWLLAAVPSAYLAADLLSGVVHWFCDTFFDEDTPLVGQLVIHPFRDHHRDPLALTRHGFLEVSGNSCLALLPVLVPMALLRGTPSSATSAFIVAFVVCFSLSVFATNQLHKWAHAPVRPRIVAWLQRSGLILSPEGHALHHRRPNRKAYCVTSGWLNPPLDAIDFFARLERAVRVIEGALAGRTAAGSRSRACVVPE